MGRATAKVAARESDGGGLLLNLRSAGQTRSNLHDFLHLNRASHLRSIQLAPSWVRLEPRACNLYSRVALKRQFSLLAKRPIARQDRIHERQLAPRIQINMSLTLRVH